MSTPVPPSEADEPLATAAGDVDLGSPVDQDDAASTQSEAAISAADAVVVGGAGAAAPSSSELEREGDLAADYLEEFLDIADLDGDIDLDVENDRAMVSIVGGDLSSLVGSDGEVLEALQELTRLAVTANTGQRSRLMLDIGGFRAGRRAALVERATEAVEEVRRSGQRVTMEPMTPFERKVIHDAVAAAGLRSESEGVEPERYVVVLPA